jgi:hypothetical protein
MWSRMPSQCHLLCAQSDVQQSLWAAPLGPQPNPLRFCGTGGNIPSYLPGAGTAESVVGCVDRLEKLPPKQL